MHLLKKIKAKRLNADEVRTKMNIASDVMGEELKSWI